MRGEQRVVDTGTSAQASSGSAQQRNQTQSTVSGPQVRQPIPSAQNPPRQTLASTLNANSCSDTELLALPGMSAPVARAIISEREQNGPYQSLEDLVTRNGLKPHVVAAFIGNLAVSAPSAAHAGSQHVRMLDL